MRHFSRPITSLLVVTFGLIVSLIYFQRAEIYHLYSEATGESANLVVLSKTPMTRRVPIWRHLAQGGEDLTTNMLTPIEPKLRSLEAETIRLDHVLSGYDVVAKDQSGNLTFNWTRLDDIINTITRLGATPMLSLSYMPPAISSGDITDAPRDWNDWALVVQRTIEHYSKDLNLANVAYEVWNEPDLFGKWSTHGRKNYLNLYRYAAIGAGRVQGAQPFRFGGPALTGAYPAWLDSFLNAAETENLRLNFLSWHRYSRAIEDYQNDIEMVRAVLERYPSLAGSVQLYVTEVGPTSEVDPVYDTTFAAAHLVAVTRVLWGRVDRLYTFEIVDGPSPTAQPFWGRWGIITHPETGGFVKPRFDALRFLNRLEGEQLTVKGEGTWVKALAAQDSQGIINLVVVNYDPLNRHREEEPLVIDQLDPGTYQLRQSLIGGGTVTNAITVTADSPLAASLNLPPQAVMLLEVIT